MTALAHSIGRRDTASSALASDLGLIVFGSVVIAALAQLSIPLPFTPVPITGQTLAVLLVGASLGAARGSLSVLLYLAEGAVGLPVFAEAKAGFVWLLPSSPTGGYLWGFVVAAFAIGFLAQRGWDRGIRSSIGAMLVGEVIIFAFGVSWLANAFGLSAEQALVAGLYPFVIGEVIKLFLAASALPAAWRLVGRDERQ